MATLRALRQALAYALDDLGVYPITSSSATATTVAALINSTANASVNRYDGRYLYVSAGTAMGESEVVKTGGYAPATGVLTVKNFWNTQPGAGDTLEITGLFPSRPGVQGEMTDYRTLVNRACGRLLAADRLSVTTVAGLYEYPLTAYAAWLDLESRLTVVLDPPRASGYPSRPTWRRWELELDGGTPRLQFLDRAYPTSGATFELAVLRPTNTLVNGAESTVGLVADTDTVQAQVEDVVAVGRWLAYEALAVRTVAVPGGDWVAMAKAQLAECRKLRAWDWPQDKDAPAAAPTQAVA